MSWFRNKPDTPVPPEPPLKPGQCECGHNRCSHDRGVGPCNCAITTDDDDKTLPRSEWSDCACRIFILDDDADGPDSPPETPIDPEVVELTRMVKL